ncbi:uncharacterized protein LOC132257788 [Phlebotomus argentipes]|uniref:uncharacterized protein LOC132257788 n=1 Tax=Phlebotomus argentipes TaxID=94469 RepID=UPI002892B649|nr:uncharacterized protein LOC132257788 [Phlebotomus argentipes]
MNNQKLSSENDSTTNFYKKFFNRKPEVTIVAHVLTSEEKNSPNEIEPKKVKKNSRSTKSSNSTDEDAKEKKFRPPPIPTPPFPEDKCAPSFPINVKDYVQYTGKSEKQSVVAELYEEPSVKNVSQASLEEVLKAEKAPQDEKHVIEEEKHTVKSKSVQTVEAQKAKVPQKASEPQRKSYITSVETWRPTSVRIICNKCGQRSRPILRTYTRRLATSQIAANCILTCWPLCFLPCLAKNIQQQFLYCSKCDYCLGEFQQKKR